MMKLTVVSPTYNEAANIARLSQEVHAALSGMDYELLIVDDDSPDRTWAVAQELAKANGHIRVIHRTKGRGLSAAVIEGIHSSVAEYVAVIDADLQHNPEILPKMVEALDAGAEIAVGSRYRRRRNWSVEHRSKAAILDRDQVGKHVSGRKATRSDVWIFHVAARRLRPS